MSNQFFKKIKILRNNIYVLGGKWFQYREQMMEQLDHCSGVEKILDAGCGDAWIKDEFKRFNKTVDYYGIDLGVGDENLTYRLHAFADLHSIPFKSNSFDKVTSNSVLEHVEYPDQVFSEMARVVTPGGRIFLNVPLTFYLHQTPYDFHRFTKYTLEKFAQRNNLKIVEMWPQGGVFTVLRYIFTNYGFQHINDNMLWKVIAIPFFHLARFIDRIIGAPIVFLLDKLDHKKLLTLGYFVIYEKEGEAKSLGPEQVQFRCPECYDDKALLDESLKCPRCGAQYLKVEGIPNLVLRESFRPRSRSFDRID